MFGDFGDSLVSFEGSFYSNAECLADLIRRGAPRFFVSFGYACRDFTADSAYCCKNYWGFFGVIYRGGEARNCDFSKKQA